MAAARVVVSKVSVGAVLILTLTECKGGAGVEADAGADGPPWAADKAEPDPRPGMVWIPSGPLHVGTPPGKLPRVADEEMAGEQVVMHGFFLDTYPHPNELGAIPTTNVTQGEAKAICEGQGKRLCTELELERACKGPGNTSYEYGEKYEAEVCGTGVARALIPNGFNTTCQSAFGAHDLHGGVWVWTSSPWKRDPTKTGLVAIRGGNGTAGDLIGRCANGRGSRPDVKREEIGVRCCAGDVNTFEVTLSVAKGVPLRWQSADDRIAPALEKILPADMKALGLKVERVWTWHPLGNEELYIGGGCAKPADAPHPSCGIVIGRLGVEGSQGATYLGWVSAEWWKPALSEADSWRELYLAGGDVNGGFRRKVTYAWGRIEVGEKERKKRRHGSDEMTW